MKNIRHNGDITMDDIYNAARVIRPKSLAVDFSGIYHDHDDDDDDDDDNDEPFCIVCILLPYYSLLLCFCLQAFISLNISRSLNRRLDTFKKLHWIINI